MKKVYIITGSGGIGYACATQLGKKGIIVFADVSEKTINNSITELEKLGIESIGIKVDISNRDEVIKLFEEAKKLGDIVAVINTAALSPACEDVTKIMNVDVNGPLNVVEVASNYLTEGGSMISFASGAAHYVQVTPELKQLFEGIANHVEGCYETFAVSAPNADAAYAMAKRFVIYLTQFYTIPYGNKGLRIVSVSPGNTKTEMLKSCMEVDPETYKNALKNTPMKRFGNPYEVANLVDYLISDQASYITGVDVPCDGGLSALIALM